MPIYSLTTMGPKDLGYASDSCAELFGRGTGAARALEISSFCLNGVAQNRYLYSITGGSRGASHLAPVNLLPWDLNSPPSNSMVEFRSWGSYPTSMSAGLIGFFGNTYNSQISFIFPLGLVYSATRTIVIWNSSAAVAEPCMGFVVEE